MTRPSGSLPTILTCLALAGCSASSRTAPITTPPITTDSSTTPTTSPPGGGTATRTTAQLTGTVSDDTGSRLPGSTVQITTGPHAGLTVTADPGGIYRFEIIQIGTITLVARAGGYVDSTRSVTVNAIGLNTLHFTLARVGRKQLTASAGQ